MIETDLPQNSPNNLIRFRNLDVIRFISVYILIFFYAFYGWVANYGYPEFMLNPQKKLSAFGKYLENAIHNFSVGIDIIFLVSAFLITYFLIEEKEQSGKINILRFYLRRILRIWPLYFIIIITVPILSHLMNEPVPGYKYYFSFAGNFEIIKYGFSSAVINNLWPICILMQFYLVIPWLVSYFQVKKIPSLLAPVILLSIVYRGMISGSENYWMNMYLNTVSRIDVLAIGSITAYYFFFNRSLFRDTYNLRFHLLLIFVFIFINTDMMDWDGFFAATVKKYFFIMILVYLIGNFALRKNSARSKLFNFSYQLSFSAYVISPVVILVIIKSFNYYHYHNLLIFIILLHLIIPSIALLSYKLIEAPFIRLKEKFLWSSSTEPKEISYPGFF